MKEKIKKEEIEKKLRERYPKKEIEKIIKRIKKYPGHRNIELFCL